MPYLIKDRKRIYVPGRKFKLHGNISQDVSSVITPTVTGGCDDPTCDLYDLLGDGVDAQVVSEATSNLELENTRALGEAGSWYAQGASAVALSSAWYIYGSGCMQLTGDNSGQAWTGYKTVVNGQPYSVSCFVKNNKDSSKIIRLREFDSVGGNQQGSDVTVEAGEVKLINHTFTVQNTSALFGLQLGSDDCDFYFNAWQRENLAYPTWFSNGDRVGMTQSVPTANLPIYAGGPMTWVIHCGPSPWPGNDGRQHTFFDTYAGGSVNEVILAKISASKLRFNICDGAGDSKYIEMGCGATEWPIGSKNCIIVRRDPLGNPALRLNRADATTIAGAGTGLETAFGTSFKMGHEWYGNQQINMPAHFAFLNRYITDDECEAIEDELGVA